MTPGIQGAAHVVLKQTLNEVVIPEGAGPCQHVTDQRFCRLSASV
jgi:hypothetical protein